MKRMIVFVISCLLFISGYGQQVREIKITELSDYIAKSEKPLVVNFWATWCAPCLEELPWFQSTIKEKYNGKVELLLVSLDAKQMYPAVIKNVMQKRSISAPVVWLNESDADYFCPKIDSGWSGAIPSSLFINNKKQYRKFFERQLLPKQLEIELKLLTD